jgi:pimeloyl-ACP methyl ester carboxylesterase/DNA-binding CsgD family transcriptional regulator
MRRSTSVESPPLTRHLPSVRFCSSADGTRIAWTRAGSGLPIVRAAHFLTHIERDVGSQVWGPLLAALAREGEVIRYDQRGCGLSDHDVDDCSLDAMVADLAAVVDAAGLDRFVLFGPSQGGAIAIRYAARHPERVHKLVLLGGFSRGPCRRGLGEEAEARARLMISMIELGWGQGNPAFHQAFSTMLMPDAPPELTDELNDLQRASTTPAQAARIFSAVNQFDASADIAYIVAPTLVAHARDDARVPLSEGRLIAAGVRDARFAVLESRNHVLVRGEPAFDQFFSEVHAFLAEGAAPDSGAFPSLTPRERDLLQLVAMGLDNAQIAARLSRSEKTVRNNVSALFERLGVENRSQAIVRARNAGFGRES